MKSPATQRGFFVPAESCWLKRKNVSVNEFSRREGECSDHDQRVNSAPVSRSPTSTVVRRMLTTSKSCATRLSTSRLRTLHTGRSVATCLPQFRPCWSLHIRGLIQFEVAGTYVFPIESNDGVKAKIGGCQIWVDPKIHPNRWSAPIPVVIDVPGWYELWINY